MCSNILANNIITFNNFHKIKKLIKHKNNNSYVLNYNIQSDKGYIFMNKKHEDKISKPIFPKMCVL